ncbi:hypothetical protein [Ramlibacter humi]|uniref:Uncharacterized protein n=1 Tax=Ramlibacter humi TaxID=2530451 RepID=A0A4Z0CC42_9BURK|nr:hypothetical protein [Ramlibacter humi]TFZ08951.1 hypothetical protein EZ216_07355 [Ramlibacter humi]
MDQDVPADFPQEFLSAVSGAQPKLAVYRTSDGRYIDESVGLRAERWGWCVDLLEQLVDYVHAHVVPMTPAAYTEKVCASVMRARFRQTRGISLAEADWLCMKLRERLQDQ